MSQSKKIIIVLLFLAFLAMVRPDRLVSASRLWSPHAQDPTIPTRTPTPPPASPSPTAPPTSTPASIPPTSPPSGSTSVPPTTVPPTTVPGTNTPVPPPPTPLGGYLPTAQPCGNPTAQAFAGINVRSGPGLEYDVVHLMVYLEVRPIIGRAEPAHWWLIQLPAGRQGWVFDGIVTVTGNINTVPVVENVGEPPAWNPVNPACPFTATATPLPSQTATTIATTLPATVTTTPSRTPTGTPPTGDSSSTATPTSTGDGIPVVTMTTMPASSAPTSTPNGSAPTTVAVVNNITPSATQLSGVIGNNSTDTGSKGTTTDRSSTAGEGNGFGLANIPWTLCCGLLLILLALLLFFFRRKEEEEETEGMPA